MKNAQSSVSVITVKYTPLHQFMAQLNLIAM